MRMHLPGASTGAVSPFAPLVHEYGRPSILFLSNDQNRLTKNPSADIALFAFIFYTSISQLLVTSISVPFVSTTKTVTKLLIMHLNTVDVLKTMNFDSSLLIRTVFPDPESALIFESYLM